MPTPSGLIHSGDICNQAVVERALRDGSVASIKLAADIQSDTYDGGVITSDPGTAGWRIERTTGNAVFDGAYIRGTLSAASIAAANITAGTMDGDVFVADGTITAGKIGANEITATQIAAATITTTEINGTAGITGSQIAGTTITGSNIVTGSIDTLQITAGAITATEIETNAISAAAGHILDLDAGDITAGTLSADRIATGSISPLKLSTGETGAITITLGTGGVIQSTDVSPDIVINGDGSATFKNLTVTGTSSVDGALVGTGITATNITTGGMSAARITSGTIDASVITVTNLNASNISTGTLAAARIAAGSLDGDRITAGTLDADRITAGSLSSASGVFGTISAAEITTGTMSADRISGGSISGSIISGGTITGTTVDAGTITTGTLSADRISGGTGVFGVQSASGGSSRIETGVSGAVTTINFYTAAALTGYVKVVGGAMNVGSGSYNLTLDSPGTIDLSGSNVAVPDGTAGTPGLNFASDSNTGFYRPAVDSLNVALGGVSKVSFQSTLLDVGMDIDLNGFDLLNRGNDPSGGGWEPEATSELHMNGFAITEANYYRSNGSGSAGTPAFQFATDTDTGIYLATTAQLAFSVAGVQEVRIEAGQTVFGGNLNLQSNDIVNVDAFSANNDDAASNPAYTWNGDLNTGMFWNGADNIGLSTGGTGRVFLSTGVLTSTLPIRGPDASAGAPTFSFDSDTTTGIYRQGTDSIGFATGGAEQFRVTNNTNYSMNNLDMQGQNIEACSDVNFSGYLTLNGAASFHNSNEINLSRAIYMSALAVGSSTNISINTGTNQILENSSSRRWKKNIKDLKESDRQEIIAAIRGLRVRRFDGKANSDFGPNRLGLIAEETFDIHPEFVALGRDGLPSAISQLEYDTAQTVAIQDLYTRVEQLENA